MGLYQDILPNIQQSNTYGGGYLTLIIKKDILNALSQLAEEDDATAININNGIIRINERWNEPEDYQAISQLIETYCEGSFYLAAKRKLNLVSIPETKHNKTPDFQTISKPAIHFEVKTLDMSEPDINMSKIMLTGLDATIEASEKAKKTGVGSSNQTISPHGDTNSFHNAIEQIIDKTSNNIKINQYSLAPTFLILNLCRTGISLKKEELFQHQIIPPEYLSDNKKQNESGKMWTIANHKFDHTFKWLDLDNSIQSQKLQRDGILKQYSFIQGIIFTTESLRNSSPRMAELNQNTFYGLWNENCTGNFTIEQTHEAHKIFKTLCDYIG